MQGGNEFGSLGNGVRDGHSNVPVRALLPEGVKAQSVSCGRHHTCILSTDRKIYCTGKLLESQSVPLLVPTLQDVVPEGRTVVSVQAGDFFTCMLLDDGETQCWYVAVFTV